MPTTEALVFVFTAALITDLATGLGAVPFFFVDEVSNRAYVIWGFASGIMLSTSIFGLLSEGAAQGPIVEVAGGTLVGILLVFVVSQLLTEYEIHPQTISAADFRRLLLIVETLTIHSFLEGVAVGDSFADLNIADSGVTVPLFALFVTVAISLKTPEITNRRFVFWAVFSSAPQPLALLCCSRVTVVSSFGRGVPFPS